MVAILQFTQAISQSLGVLCLVESFTLESLMIRQYEESRDVFVASDRVYRWFVVVNCQLLHNLSESVPEETINLAEIMLVAFWSWVCVVRFAFCNAILVCQAISNVADYVKQDEWTSHVFWFVHCFVSCWSTITLDRELLKSISFLSQLEIVLSTYHFFCSFPPFSSWTHIETLCFILDSS